MRDPSMAYDSLSRGLTIRFPVANLSDYDKRNLLDDLLRSIYDEARQACPDIQEYVDAADKVQAFATITWGKK